MTDVSNSISGKLGRLDIVLVLLYLGLVIFGWMNVYSAVHAQDVSAISLGTRSGKQLLWIGLSVVTATAMVLFIPRRLYETLALPIYLFSIFLLGIVLLIGTSVNGSHSWIVLGPVSFQPAEIVKISASLLIAKAMSAYGFNLHDKKSFLRICGIILLPIALILLENETGCALVLLGFIIPLYREGLSGWILILALEIILLFIMTLTLSPLIAVLTCVMIGTFGCEWDEKRVSVWMKTWLPGCLVLLVWVIVYPEVFPDSTSTAAKILNPVFPIIAGGAVGVIFYVMRLLRNLNPFRFFTLITIAGCILLSLSVDFIFNNILQEHQRVRIEVLLGMKEDSAGAGYNVHQSMIAIGSGGFAGKGYLNGTQTTYGFVPEQATDFIFCTIGEEWGFLGSAFVILMYIGLISRIISKAEDCRDNFTRIYGYCVASCLIMHFMINIGMTIGLMPVIGIPLPLVSYGGSSLLAFSILIFIFIVLESDERKFFGMGGGLR